MKKNTANIIHGDVKNILQSVPDNFYDGMLSDFPYGLSFMGKKWDYQIPSVETCAELLRVLKPGAYALVFGGSRTYHRMVCNLEDAGFTVRDTLTWLQGQGFPKSRAIDKAAAKQWEGYGTALKPAVEFILLGQKPVEEGLTIAANCLKWGCGGLNIDGTRIGLEEIANTPMVNSGSGILGWNKPEKISTPGTFAGGEQNRPTYKTHYGRFPANLILDEEAAKALDKQVGVKKAVSRFFYCAKVSAKERNAGLEDAPDVILARSGGAQTHAEKDGEQEYTEGQGIGLNRIQTVKNNHPCLKPISLCQYLSKLILPPDRENDEDIRKLLVPFAGSGSEAIGSGLAGWDYVEGIEREEDYVKIARTRCKYYEDINNNNNNNTKGEKENEQL